MFTIEQIKQAHVKVKSGADFPAYIKYLKQLGVRYYAKNRPSVILQRLCQIRH
jgi:hypothetical protein